MAIKILTFKNGNTETRKVQEKEVSGDSVRVFLHSGASFNLKVTETEPGYISGFDDERLDIKISTDDIDYVMGGRRVG